MAHETYEDGLQFAVADYLDLQGWLWCHVPNEIKAKPQYQAKLNRKGRKSGVPDVMIFERWHHPIDCDSCVSRDDVCHKLGGEACESYSMHDDSYGHGVVIELKAPGKYPTPKQREWLAALKKRDWATFVCRTTSEAMDACKIIG